MWFAVSGMIAPAGKMWQSPLHVVKVKSQWLLTADISVLALSYCPACNLLLNTCSLANVAHVAKYFWFFFVHCVLPPLHTQEHTFLVRICLSTQRSSPALPTAWLTHSSPVWAVMSWPSPFGPTWQREITLKSAWIFSFVPSSPFLSLESG